MLGGMPARVGVVVRTHQRPDFLARALADIASQAYDGWETVVVNDGGDRAPVDAVVRESGVQDRVRVIHIPSGEGGRCRAANAGIQATGAEFVVLHDDDDRWDPRFLGETVAWLDAHPDDGAVATATAIVYERHDGARWVETSRVPFWEGMARISLSEMLMINRAVPISVVYRRSLHDEVGWYDESLDAVEDWEFYLRVLRRHPIGFIGGAPLAFWSQRPTAKGVDANSMFALESEHARDDLVVRDRALREWIERDGAGPALYLAGMERRLTRQIEQLRDDVLGKRHPIWATLRRLRRRKRG